MTIRFNKRGAGFAEFERRAGGAVTKKLEVVQSVLEDEGMDAANRIEEIIRSEGVRNTVPNGEGRVQSGDMAKAVDFDVKRTGRSLKLRIGWLPGDSRRRDYFQFQNDGTYAKGQPQGDPDPRPRTAARRSPRGIRPLMAVQRVHDETRDRIAYRLRRK